MRVTLTIIFSNQTIILCLFCLLAFSNLMAQTKSEREVGVNAAEVPNAAREWMKDAYEGARKYNWFKEFSDDGQSFEAKLKWEKKWHSVKFDTLGNILDIEVETQLELLPPKVHHAITKCLDSAFTKHNIRRIQIQYVGESDALEDLIDEKEEEDITTNYEIEFFGKTEEENEMWEGLFDSQGKLLKCRKIELGNVDNLQF